MALRLPGLVILHTVLLKTAIIIATWLTLYSSLLHGRLLPALHVTLLILFTPVRPVSFLLNRLLLLPVLLLRPVKIIISTVRIIVISRLVLPVARKIILSSFRNSIISPVVSHRIIRKCILLLGSVIIYSSLAIVISITVVIKNISAVIDFVIISIVVIIKNITSVITTVVVALAYTVINMPFLYPAICIVFYLTSFRAPCKPAFTAIVVIIYYNSISKIIVSGRCIVPVKIPASHELPWYKIPAIIRYSPK